LQLASVLDCNLASHLHQTSLADSVGEVASYPDHSMLRGDVDDATAGVASQRLDQQVPDCSLTEHEWAGQAHPHHRVPVAILGLEQGLGVPTSQDGVVDENVQAAVALHGQGSHPLAVLPPGDIGRYELAGSAVAG